MVQNIPNDWRSKQLSKRSSYNALNLFYETHHQLFISCRNAKHAPNPNFCLSSTLKFRFGFDLKVRVHAQVWLNVYKLSNCRTFTFLYR